MPSSTSKSDEPCVWLSISDIKSDLSFGFTCQMIEDDKDALLSRLLAFKRGAVLESEELPSVMWIARRATNDDRRKLPHLFGAAGFLTVSETFAEVLRGFDLGRTRLHPVEFLHSDQKEPFTGRYYFLNIAEVHRYFSPEHSARFEPLPNSATSYIASVGNTVEDDDISVVPAALHGPDLWIDDTLLTHFFCSDLLVRALRAAKLASQLPLYRCRVLAAN